MPPTFSTLAHSFPSTLTHANADFSLIALGWFSTPPGTCAGSNNGFINPVHTLSTLTASFPSRRILNSPFMFAAIAILGASSLLNRSTTERSECSDGNIMCTSGSGHVGSLMLATLAGESTRTGISWVTRVFDVVVIVRQRIGVLSEERFVKRKVASEAEAQERRARCRGERGTSRFITLEFALVIM
ncbi:hypothetical protein HOY82DRAFT_57338 [Tuber indicum]|nr:hypothetical protein HOY82DRAFT_57338 [Tuber indicum]